LPDAVLRIRGEVTPGHEDYAAVLGWDGAPDAEVSSLGDHMTTRDFMDACDVVVLPARPRSEGMPTVLIEAASRGKPCIATDVGATEEVVVDGVTGFLVDAGHPERAIAERLRDLDEVSLRERLGAGARHRYGERFTTDRFTQTAVQGLTSALVGKVGD
jgi:glycosyltransferase involved in cell wall biosynthesis